MVDRRHADGPGAIRTTARRSSKARQGLNQKILSGLVAIWSIRSVPAGRRIDDSRIELARLLKTETEALHDPWAKILRNDVRFRNQLASDLAAFFRPQVNRKAAFVAIGASK